MAKEGDINEEERKESVQGLPVLLGLFKFISPHHFAWFDSWCFMS